jgi:hypothetical protein
MYSYDVALVSVSGTSSTTVYAGSTQSLSLVPIATSSNTAGTAIALPNYPNSIVPDPLGKKVYLGSASGVMLVDVATNTVTTLSINSSAIKGTVLAVSPDGNYLLVADSASNQSYYVNLASSSILFLHTFFTSSGAFTPDSKWLLLLGGPNLYRDINGLSTTTTNLGYQPNNVDLLAQGSLAFITSSNAHAVDVRSTCDQSHLQTLTANAPTLVKGLPNGTGAVVTDSPGIDVITTATPSGSCPVATQNTLNTYNLGAGGFNARQLFVSTDSSHAWVLGDLPDLLSFNLSTLTPTVIPLANGAVPYTGGITMDGAEVYVGASDNNVHLIPVSSLSDTQQIAPGLKDVNSNVVPPNLVTVVPK